MMQSTAPRSSQMLALVTTSLGGAFFLLLFGYLGKEQKTITGRIGTSLSSSETESRGQRRLVFGNNLIMKENYIKSLLPDYTLQAINASSPSGYLMAPQLQAFEWMMNDPWLENYTDSPWRITQRFALATFFYSASRGGRKWDIDTGWLEYENHECEWYSSSPEWMPREYQSWCLAFAFSDRLDTYDSYSMKLSNYSNPCEEEDLDNIQIGQYKHLWLWWNNVGGYDVPPELFLMTHLKTINVDKAYRGSGFYGSLPSTIGLCTDLEVLSLGGHSLSVSAPSIGQLSSMKFLNLYSNDFDGPLSQISGMKNLEFVDLTSNGIQGPLPANIGELTRLKALLLGRNLLSGTVPSQLSMLENLSVLDLEDNSLHGTLPSQTARMTSLERLLLEGNSLSLSGPIPSQLFHLATLVSLTVKENNFATSNMGMTIPSEIGLLSNLEGTLNFYNLSLVGTICTELGRLTRLTELKLNRNDLVGELPTEIGLMTHLSRLDFSGNNIGPAVPSELGMLSYLKSLYGLSGGGFHGAIPSEFGKMWTLKYVVFWNDMLGTTIPTEIGRMYGMYRLSLGNRSLAGQIPSEVGLMYGLESISLNDNSLTGTLPEELMNLSSLTSLNLLNTQISGTIPGEMCASWKIQFNCSESLCGCDCPCHDDYGDMTLQQLYDMTQTGKKSIVDRHRTELP